MDKTMRRTLAGTATALLAISTLAGPAQADPKSDFVIDLDCGDGVVQVVAPENDQPWTPAHDIASTAVYIPLGFEGTTATITILDGPDAGTVIDVPAEEDQMKKGLRKGVDVKECTFSSVFTGYVPDFDATVHAVYSGTVFGKTTAK